MTDRDLPFALPPGGIVDRAQIADPHGLDVMMHYPPAPPAAGRLLAAILDVLPQLEGRDLDAGDAEMIGRIQAGVDKLVESVYAGCAYAGCGQDAVCGHAPVAAGYRDAFENDQELVLTLASRADQLRGQLVPLKQQAAAQAAEGCELSVREMLGGGQGALWKAYENLHLAAELLGHAAAPHPHPVAPVPPT